MKKEIFKEMFEHYIKVREQVEKYDNFMFETFNEKRDDNYTNWYEEEAYQHTRKIFKLNYEDDRDDWFGYFIFECLYPCTPNTEPRKIICNGGLKEYILDNIDNFYIFCEEQLTGEAPFKEIEEEES